LKIIEKRVKLESIRTYRLATVITEEGKWHVARAIELGVVSRGKTVNDALKNLKEAVELYLEDNPRANKHNPV